MRLTDDEKAMRDGVEGPAVAAEQHCVAVLRDRVHENVDS
jgi:hypothetical protein